MFRMDSLSRFLLAVNSEYTQISKNKVATFSVFIYQVVENKWTLNFMPPATNNLHYIDRFTQLFLSR